MLLHIHSRLQTQAFWNQDAIQQIKTPLDEQSEHGGGDGAFENGDMIIQVQTAQNWFAETAGANERGQCGRPDVNDGARFYSAEDRAGRDGQIDFPEPRERFETKRNRRFADRLRDVLQSGGGIANNREQSVKKKSGDGGAQADSKKRNRNEQGEERQGWDCLHGTCQSENPMSDYASAAGHDSERDAGDDGEQKREAGQLEMS